MQADLLLQWAPAELSLAPTEASRPSRGGILLIFVSEIQFVSGILLIFVSEIQFLISETQKQMLSQFILLMIATIGPGKTWKFRRWTWLVARRAVLGT